MSKPMFFVVGFGVGAALAFLLLWVKIGCPSLPVRVLTEREVVWRAR